MRLIELVFNIIKSHDLTTYRHWKRQRYLYLRMIIYIYVYTYTHIHTYRWAKEWMVMGESVIGIRKHKTKTTCCIMISLWVQVRGHTFVLWTPERSRACSPIMAPKLIVLITINEWIYSWKMQRIVRLISCNSATTWFDMILILLWSNSKDRRNCLAAVVCFDDLISWF